MIDLVNINDIPSKFKQYLVNIDKNSILVTSDCDTSYSNYSTAIRIGFENCFPLVKVSRKKQERTNNG